MASPVLSRVVQTLLQEWQGVGGRGKRVFSMICAGNSMCVVPPEGRGLNHPHGRGRGDQGEGASGPSLCSYRLTTLSLAVTATLVAKRDVMGERWRTVLMLHQKHSGISDGTASVRCWAPAATQGVSDRPVQGWGQSSTPTRQCPRHSGQLAGPPLLAVTTQRTVHPAAQCFLTLGRCQQQQDFCGAGDTGGKGPKGRT